MPDNDSRDSPPDSDLVGLYVAVIAVAALLAAVVGFFLIGVVAGAVILLVAIPLAGLLIYRILR